MSLGVLLNFSYIFLFYEQINDDYDDMNFLIFNRHSLVIAHRVLQGKANSEWRNTSFGEYEPFTVSVFLSVVKCGRVCKAQTYAHSGIEPSRLAKEFLQGEPKNSKNNSNFWPFADFTNLSNR